MEIIIIILIVIALFVIYKNKNSNNTTPSVEPITDTKEDLIIAGAYQSKWIFSYHEKDAYLKLKEICDRNGLYILSKVRILDLLEPVRGNKKYKTYFYKVQAKHVDFVICSSNLVAKCIIELDDSSHDKKDRQERDKFVDEVLRSVKYEIIHTREIIPEMIEPQIKVACGIKES